MPYIITTRRKYHPLAADSPENVHDVSRRAVATLDEVRGEIEELVYEITGEPVMADIPEAGGTVGPLPDGTVIEVEHVKLPWLALDAGINPQRDPRPPSDVIDAFNAAQAS